MSQQGSDPYATVSTLAAHGSDPSEELFSIVGLGASAGGLEALEEFFDNMSPRSGLAFVVIQHLSPDFKSLMDELLSRHTSIAIHRVEDGMVVRPNAIYLLPPKKEMIISGGKLLLKDKDPVEKLSLPIDTFFRSLAQDCGERAIAVVLSGTGSDGSRGAKAINNSGGLVIAQEPESARFDGMPQATIDTGVADLVLPPNEIPNELLRHIQHPSAGLPATAAIIPEDAMHAIFRLLRDQYGIDFSHYKSPTVVRRIERRLELQSVENLEDYVARISDDPEELNALYKDLLIGVTRFFRDKEAFEILAKNVLADIVTKTPADEEIRIWVSACATGEEAYSIGILLHECLLAKNRMNEVKIFATDVHRDSLDYASQGIYPAEHLADVSEERRERYFVQEKGGWQVKPELRKMIVFAPHNIIKDAPFTRIDLVTCRNLLIYLQPIAQKKALSLFHFALKTGGHLFLGPSETCGEINEEFAAVDQHWRIYRKRRDTRLPADMRLPLATGYTPGVRTARRPTSLAPAAAVDGALLRAYDSLLSAHVPPSLLINDRRELVHTFAGAGKYLVTPDGRHSDDILECLDRSIRVSVAGALQRATKTLEPVVYSGVPLANDDSGAELSITVTPFRDRLSEELFFLITIEPRLLQELLLQESTSEATPVSVSEAARERILALESDLRYSRENLQANIEEMETTNEELQATNEELVASNEELQSTNEELHSVNEELYTVNAEHQRKIRELMVMTDDMNNLFRSTEVGTLFLDRDLCIRKITPKITDTFHILRQDVGRRIDGFTHNLLYDDVFKDISAVLKQDRKIERDVCDRHGKWFLMRILPYRSEVGVDGVVLSLIDISMQKKKERQLLLMSKVFHDAGDPKVIEDFSGHVLEVNEAMTRILGWPPEELLGQETTKLVPDEVQDEIAKLRTQCRRSGSVRDVELLHRRKSGKLVSVSLTMSLLSDESGEPVAIAWMSKDISRRKKAEHELEEYSRQLEATNRKLEETIEQLKEAERQAKLESSRRDEFLAMLSHELRNPMGALLNATYVLDRKGIEESQAHPVQIIQRQAKHVGRLLDDLLDVARVSKGKIELRREVFDLTAILDDAKAAVMPLVDARRHELKIEHNGQPLTVDGDPTRLLQVIENLLINAAKYTPVGGQIKLSLRRNDSVIEISVADNGVGIDPESLESVFDLFVQTVSTDDGAGGGMGVGLTLVKQMVDLHGGTVTAHSEGSGKGCVFTVSLPFAERKLSQADSVARDLNRHRTPAETRVVLVEDNDDAREMLREMLQLDGYRVDAASDGAQGLNRILELRPDVALIDIGLPELDGYQVAQAVRSSEDHANVRLVALTGYGREKDREAVVNAGFDEHLVKPVKPSELERVLRSAFDQAE